MSKKRKMVGRISYVENWHGEGEHFVFEYRWDDEDEWSFECVAPLCSWEDGKLMTGKGDFLSYTALTKLREWSKLGITDIWWR